VNRRKLVYIFALIILIVSSIIIYQKFDQQNKVIEELTNQSNEQQLDISNLESILNTTEENLRKEKIQKDLFEQELLKLKEISKSNYAVVGINSKGKGVTIPLEVIIKNGNGNYFLDVTNVRFDERLQSSVQLSIQAASEITNTDIDKKDILISIEAPAESSNTEIAGRSGGAAITIAVIAAMEEYNITHDVLITGTIEKRHIIGEVGFVNEKAIAARDEGAIGFIVPIDQKVWIPGLEIVEALTVEDAWKYIIQTTSS
jgi:predicted ATP-dependent protease